jgi:aryl-alcohol dehydrogenase-like predicted oxidoreductase
MTLRTLGKSDLKITPIGIGSWAIGGGKWEFAWGAQDDKESIAAIHAGLDRGINWIDTAAVYGLGHSETMVGRAVRGLSERPFIFTKCSLVWDEAGNISHNLQAASVRKEAEASLKRLGVDAIDLYQIHWPAWKGCSEVASPGSIEEAMGELAKLKTEGKIRNIGVSNFSAKQMQRAIEVAPVASLQPPYSLLARDAEESILPFALTHHIGVIVYSPMASGLLSGAMTRERIATLPEDDWRKRSKNFQEPALSQNAISRSLGRSLVSASLSRWRVRSLLPIFTSAPERRWKSSKSCRCNRPEQVSTDIARATLIIGKLV